MTDLLTWLVFAAIPLLMIAAGIRAYIRKDPPDHTENVFMLIGFCGLAVAWAATLGGAA